MDLVAVDVETTGLSPAQDRIVEFCFNRFNTDFEVQDRWTDRVDPGIPVPADAAAVHGITRRDVAQKPGFHRYAPGIQSFLQDCVVVAYNAAFDLRFLHHELQRHGRTGFTEPVPVIDPLHVFKTRFDASYTLEEAYEALVGEPHDAAHSADGDVAATVTVLQHQVQHLDACLHDLVSSFRT